MRTPRRGLWILPWLIAPVAAWGDGERCREVEARGVGQDLGGGVTKAQITGDRLLRGTTQAQFSIVSVQGTVAMLVGTVVFTERKATMNVGVVGTFDLSTGAFVALSTKLTGTGRLEGVRGNLRFEGVEDFTTGEFTEKIRGRLGLPHDDDDGSDRD